MKSIRNSVPSNEEKLKNYKLAAIANQRGIDRLKRKLDVRNQRLNEIETVNNLLKAQAGSAASVIKELASSLDLTSDPQVKAVVTDLEKLASGDRHVLVRLRRSRVESKN